MKKIITLLFISFLTFFIGCENSNEPILHENGTVTGKVTVGNKFKVPKNQITLKLYNGNGTIYRYVNSVVTDSAGEFIFNNLELGIYSICSTQDENYIPFKSWQNDDVLCKSFEVTQNNKSFIKNFQLFAWHNFTSDTVTFILNNTNWSAKSVNTNFFNDGVRDTLNWSFNSNSIPEWLSVSPMNGCYEPENISDKWLSLTIQRSSFPVLFLNKSLTLEISHQFGRNFLVVVFKNDE
jgi:hypothetical protein